jgi:hypothetical protein
VYQKEGKVYGKTSSGFFRHRWWHFYERGLSYAEGQYYEDAVADLTAAIAQRGKDQRMARTYGMHFVDYFPHRELGIVHYERGDLEAARNFLLRSIDHDPSAKAYYYLDRVRSTLIRQSGASAAPPRIHLDIPQDEMWTREEPVTIEGTASDSNYVREVRINGLPIYMEKARQQQAFKASLDLPEGSHPISVEAVNLGGTIASRTIVFHVDRQGPLIVMERIDAIPDDGGTIFQLSGILFDHSEITSLTINSESVFIGPGKRFQFRYVSSTGGHPLRVVATDRLGNLTAADIGIGALSSRPSRLVAAFGASMFHQQPEARDHTPPSIELKGWSDHQTVFMDKVYIDGIVADRGGLSELTVNNESIGSSRGRMVLFNRVVPLNIGSNTISVVAEDSAGNIASKSIRIIRQVPEAFQLDARLKVTVLPFERIGYAENETAIFQDYLIDALLHRDRFRIVDRSILDVILKELHLSSSKLVDRNTALEVGRLAAAQSVIAGSIVESRQGIEIVSRIIDTETSDVLATIDVFGENKDRLALYGLAEGMALKYHKEFPLSNGMVIQVSGDTIVSDLGEEEIKLHRRVIIYREAPVRHPLNNRLMGSDKKILCRARVTQVQEEISKARLSGSPGTDVEVLHKVVAE